MRFLIRKRRSAPTVIIVALIDVLIVLVIFLLVTTTFKQQLALHVALPESSEAKRTGANENPPLVVSIDAEGNLRVGENKLPVTFEDLKARLKSESEKNPQLTLAINADEQAPWGKVVKVKDAAAEAKIKSLIAYTKASNRPH